MVQIPAKYKSEDWVQSLISAKRSATTKAKNALALAGSPMEAVKQGGISLGCAGLGGYLDARSEGYELAGFQIRPSLGLAFGMIGAGLASGRREAIDAAVGFAAPHAYQYGRELALSAA